MMAADSLRDIVPSGVFFRWPSPWLRWSELRARAAQRARRG